MNAPRHIDVDAEHPNNGPVLIALFGLYVFGMICGLGLFAWVVS